MNTGTILTIACIAISFRLSAITLDQKTALDTLAKSSTESRNEIRTEFSFRDIPVSNHVCDLALIVPNGTVVSFPDAATGSRTIYYAIDGGSRRLYNTPVRLNTKGRHSLSVWSVDDFGNAGILKKIEYFILE